MVELRRVKADFRVNLSDILAATGRLPSGWTDATEPIGVERDIDLVVQLCRKAAALLEPNALDAWVAPRLHAALRLPRRTAQDDGLWMWLALQCSEFVKARFGKAGATLHPWRYRGPWSRNALGRLWWGAEMTHNGSDYTATELCFARTRTAQFALELMYSWDRAAAIAFCQVAEGADGGPRLADRELRTLSTRLKVLLTLKALDLFGEFGDEDACEFDQAWASHQPTLTALTVPCCADLPGPTSGRVASERVKEVAAWYRTVLADDGDGDSPQAFLGDGAPRLSLSEGLSP
jgi:hypothetical protein